MKLSSKVRGARPSMAWIIPGAFVLMLLWIAAMLHQTERLPQVKLEYRRGKASQYNETKVALLIEGRPMKTLVPMMLHMISVIPDDWRHMYLGSNESIALINSSLAIQNYVNIGKLDLIHIPDNMTIHDGETTSQFLTTPYLYETVIHPAEYLLLWQTDSILCAASNRTVDEFLEYDWVGAPWNVQARFGGNGGLSFRRVSSMLQLLHAQRRIPHEDPPEDVWYSNGLYRRPGAKMANGSIELQFSMETSASDEFYPMGYHIGASGRLPSSAILGTKEKRKRVWDYCPELKLALVNMDAEKFINGECGSVWKREEEPDEYWLPDGMYAWGIPNPELI